MKKFILIFPAILFLTSCTSVKLGTSSLSDVHYTESTVPKVYNISFIETASAWPVYDWKLRVKSEDNKNIYMLHVYSNLRNKKPDSSIHFNKETCYTTISIAMPGFRPDIDAFILVGPESSQPIQLRKTQPTSGWSLPGKRQPSKFKYIPPEAHP